MVCRGVCGVWCVKVCVVWFVLCSVCCVLCGVWRCVLCVVCCVLGWII